jgi:hypothetical protein
MNVEHIPAINNTQDLPNCLKWTHKNEDMLVCSANGLPWEVTYDVLMEQGLYTSLSYQQISLMLSAYYNIRLHAYFTLR